MSDNVAQVADIVGWLQGTELEAALAEMFEVEREHEPGEKRLTKVKKRVASVMRG